jgi:PII-like signaling protein
MDRDTEALLLRVFVGESDRWAGKPIHLALIEKARQAGLAGATVVRGVEGYGAHSVIHTTRLLEMSSDLPIIVEIVDTPEKVEEEIVTEGLATVERVRVIFYRPGEPK